MDANAASLASSMLSSSSSAVKRQSLCFKRWFKRPFRCLRNSTRFENRGMLSHLPVSVPFSMRITTTTHYEHTDGLPAELAVELVLQSNERTPMIATVESTVECYCCHSRATISTCDDIDVLCCLRKKDPDQTLEIAWLLLLAGVFNMSFSMRASGIGA